MKKEIRKVKKGIVQITTVDERFYARQTENKETGLPEFEYIPSVTWIASYYPKGIGFYKWLASKGWDEAEAIKQEAGDRGSKVHYASEDIFHGKEVKMGDKYINPSTEEEEELTIEEYGCLMSLVDWIESVEKLEVIAVELTEFNSKYGYAGTIDLICRIDGQLYLVDLKTSSRVWPSHELQISAYSHLDVDLKRLKIKKKEWEKRRLGILQLGYTRNKRNWKFTEIEDKFKLFLHAKAIWKNENEGVKPQQKDYPLSLRVKKLAPKKVKKNKKKKKK